MRKTLLTVAALSSLSFGLASADMADTRAAFTNALAHCGNGRVDVIYIEEYGFKPKFVETEAFSNLVSCVSNDVASVTNDMSFYLGSRTNRVVFLHLAPYIGTNAFTGIWNGLLDTFETNQTAVTATDIGTLWLLEPMSEYVMIHYDEPAISNCLVRTRDVFRRHDVPDLDVEVYDETLSGFRKWLTLLMRAEARRDTSFVLPDEILQRYYREFESVFALPPEADADSQ